MPRPHKQQLRFIIGLTVITILFSVYNLCLLDDSWFMDSISRPERHVIKFASVLIVYAMGVFAFSVRQPGWLLPLWNFLYAALLLLLVVLGLFDTYVRSFSAAMRSLGVSVHVFLISPIPYVLLTIIGNATGRIAGRR
ncbi:MAG TPA: hypothetical protein VHE54_13465 [Puia sp.]|nr:hypothetical protein [Puia sp.]